MAIELTTASSVVRTNIRELLNLDVFTKDLSGNLVVGGTGNRVLSGTMYSSFFNTISGIINGQGNYIIGGGSHILNNAFLCGVQSGVENSILSSGNCFQVAGTRNNINLSSNTLILGGSGNSTNYVGYGTIFNSVKSVLANGSNNRIEHSAFGSIYDTANCSVINSVDCGIENAENSCINHSGISYVFGAPYTSLQQCISTNITAAVDVSVLLGTKINIIDSQSVNCSHTESATINFCQGVEVSNSRFVSLSGVKNSIMSATSAVMNRTNYSLMLGGSGHRIANKDFITIIGGKNNVSTFSNTYMLGSSLTATQADTVYTENVINKNKMRSKSVDLIAPNGTVYNLSIDNTGTLVISAL